MSVGRIIKHVSLYMTIGSLILLFVALGAAEFLTGSFTSGKSKYQVLIGLFSSCSTVGGYHCANDPFWWAPRSVRLMNKHWRAFQSFLIIDVVFKAVTLMLMRNRHRIELRNPSRISHIRILLPMMQAATAVVGAVAIGLAVTAEQRFEKQFGASLKQGMSLQLEIASFTISTFAFLLYSIAWCAEPKTFAHSGAGQLQSQQVIVNINGQSVQATLKPSHAPSAPPAAIPMSMPMHMNIHPMVMPQRVIYPVQAQIIQQQFAPIVPAYPYAHPSTFPTIHPDPTGEHYTQTGSAI